MTAFAHKLIQLRPPNFSPGVNESEARLRSDRQILWPFSPLDRKFGTNFDAAQSLTALHRRRRYRWAAQHQRRTHCQGKCGEINIIYGFKNYHQKRAEKARRTYCFWKRVTQLDESRIRTHNVRLLLYEYDLSIP